MAQHQNSVYRKISEDIADKIKKGEYTAGAMLEPERKLMEAYGVERTTVRRALELLVSEGLIVKKAGLGSFVSDGKSIPVVKKEAAQKVASEKTKPAKTRAALPSCVKLQNDYASAAAQLFAFLSENAHDKVICISENAVKHGILCGEAVKYKMYDEDLFVLNAKNNADDVFVTLWRGLRSPKPTAVIVENENAARLVMTTAERMRLSVPEELSVIVLTKDGPSDVAGCTYKNEEKNLIKMLKYTEDSDLCGITVLNPAAFDAGSTAAKANKDKSGSGTISSFLL